MYSLYRAWFGAEESYPRLETLSPPDTVVRVGNDGEYHFVAHRNVLAAHSGYLKALLAATAGTAAETSGASVGDAPAPIITSVTVPSTIGGEAFAPLLNYMYTGRLEVSLDNIYTVLLATHLLHMPGALEQCRAALLRLRAPPAVAPVSDGPTSTSPTAQQQQSSSILRPVPNRLLGPSFCWPQTATATGHLYPPRHLELPHLPALQLPPAISVLPTPIAHKSSVSYSTKEPSISPSSCSSQHLRNARSASASPELVVASSSASSVTQRSDDHNRPPSSRASPSASSERVSVGEESQPQPSQPAQQQQQQQQQQPSLRRRRPSQQQSSRQSSRSGRNSQAERSSSTSSAGNGPLQTPGIVYDVACCDGPVRFHRVLNENYAPTAAQVAQHPQHRILPAQCNGRTSGCREPQEPGAGCQENDENEQAASMNNNGEGRSGSYTCGYCRHTFKSQYCYRKHARRHLLPTVSENASTEQRQLLQLQQPQQPPQPPSQQPSQPPAEGKKREVRLLDLNVQYYPCKICGSKFPSYYFVHKHRKLCHANVEEPRAPSASAEEQKSALGAQEQQQSAASGENSQQQPA